LPLRQDVHFKAAIDTTAANGRFVRAADSGQLIGEGLLTPFSGQNSSVFATGGIHR